MTGPRDSQEQGRESAAQVEIDDAPGEVTITVTGELDMAVAPRFARQIRSLVESRDARFVIDMRELEFIDSHGVRALVEIAGAAADAGRRLALRVADDGSVRRVVDIVGLDQVIPLA